jgi:hypothetical protein
MRRPQRHNNPDSAIKGSIRLESKLLLCGHALANKHEKGIAIP